nr:MAG TPA: tail-collar fiber protein [Caudoviricetes sp.]
MAEWSNATMTGVGADLQAKVNAGKTKLTFTKIKVGSGVNATNPLALTDVISSKWETTNFVVKQEGKIVSVDTFITNNGITEAFRMSEIGLFAQDPDKGEVLYAYLTDPEPDRMPAEGGSVVVSQELTIGMVFSNTGNVSLTVNIGALVTHEQLERHNSDEHAHDDRFNAIIQQVKNMITSVDNSDSLAKAPTLQLVKTLLSSLNIKNATDVVNALESEKATGLGIRYDFSNVNAWYICLGKLFGNLIIQGGRVNITVGRNIYNDDTIYPIAFNNLPSVNIINIADTLDQDGWVTSAIKSITNLKFTYMTAQNSVTGISWIAIGS